MESQASPPSSRVDAYCTTGTSPGPRGSVAVAIDSPLGALRAQVGFEVHGPPHAPAVVVLGGISADRHLAPAPFDRRPGWWPGVVGPGAPLDPARHRLVGVDYLGGPRAPLPPGATVSARDQARSVLAVLRSLGVGSATWVGASYGGMVTLEASVLEPGAVTSAVVLCAAHRPHPLATGWRSVQRDIVRLGLEAGDGARGVELARALAMTTYRSDVELDARFGHRAPDRAHDAFPVDGYLRARGRAFAGVFPPAAYLCLSTSIDLVDVDPGRLTRPTTLVSFDTDRLVPPWLVSELAELAPGVVEHVGVATPFGHDGFLKEASAVGRILARRAPGHGIVTARGGAR